MGPEFQTTGNSRLLYAQTLGWESDLLRINNAIDELLSHFPGASRSNSDIYNYFFFPPDSADFSHEVAWTGLEIIGFIDENNELPDDYGIYDLDQAEIISFNFEHLGDGPFIATIVEQYQDALNWLDQNNHSVAPTWRLKWTQSRSDSSDKCFLSLRMEFFLESKEH